MYGGLHLRDIMDNHGRRPLFIAVKTVGQLSAKMGIKPVDLLKSGMSSKTIRSTELQWRNQLRLYLDADASKSKTPPTVYGNGYEYCRSVHVFSTCFDRPCVPACVVVNCGDLRHSHGHAKPFTLRVYRWFRYLNFKVTPTLLRHSCVTNQVIMYNEGAGIYRGMDAKRAIEFISRRANSGKTESGEENAVKRYSWVAMVDPADNMAEHAEFAFDP